MTKITENTIEEFAIELLERLGYQYIYAPDIAPGGLVINFMERKPESGNLFVFVNRMQNRMKILFWDRHGFWLFYKQLESGRFQLPLSSNSDVDISISYEQLVMIIEGIDFSSIKRRKRFTKKIA